MCSYKNVFVFHSNVLVHIDKYNFTNFCEVFFNDTLRAGELALVFWGKVVCFLHIITDFVEKIFELNTILFPLYLLH